jgi:hypothetical protein
METRIVEYVVVPVSNVLFATSCPPKLENPPNIVLEAHGWGEIPSQSSRSEEFTTDV